MSLLNVNNPALYSGGLGLKPRPGN